MKTTELLYEANIAASIKDPKQIKQLSIAMKHDGTLPRAAVARLGPNPSAEDTLKLWSALLDKSLSNTRYGDLSADGKFDDWLTKLYINGAADYEDINGEGGDALGAWKALSIRGLLKEPHQDFNKLKSIHAVQRIINLREYRDALRKIQDQETINKHKKEKKEITILNNDRFLVTVPLNYGACYTFNHEVGFDASFCTGSSSGLTWFNRYADEGPIVSIFDKQNPDDVNGKWQMHAPTDQLNNGDQSITRSRGDQKFAELFPGLMKEIVAAMTAHAEEINSNSGHILKGGYDIEKAVEDIKKKFPASWASEVEKPEEPEPEQPAQEPAAQQNPEPAQAVEPPPADEQLRPFIVTLIASGRQANVPATDPEDAIRRVIQRHPTINPEDLRVEGPAQ